MSGKAIKNIAHMSGGDARKVIHLIELINQAIKDKTKIISDKDIKNYNLTASLKHDKSGEEHHNLISAFIKSMRASDPIAAIYYLARMIEAGEDPKFIARRMIIFASEDIGMALPTALVIAEATFRAVEVIGLPEARINLAHAAIYLSLAIKDRSAYNAYNLALKDVHTYGNLKIPLSLLNAPTNLMKDIGYGKGYSDYNK